MMWDLLIQNGLIFDGLGSAPVAGDIAIEHGKIVAIAPSLSNNAHNIIDASKLWITPGFIDIHTHYDLELEIAPGLSESVRHGVTSVVIGNCSLSVAVGTPQMLADIFQRVETLSHRLIEKWLQKAISWHTPAEYLNHLQQLPLGPNIAPMFGHSALRAHVMGLERSLTAQPSEIELNTMKQIARDALDAGFIGISIDMFPWHRMSGEWRGCTIPSQQAKFKEYAMLANLCRKRDRVFQVTPNLQQLSSFWDIFLMGLGIGQKPSRMTILSALDAVHDRRLWKIFLPLLFIWNRIFNGNVRFQTLTEPFTIYSDGSVTPLFEEFSTGAQLNSCQSREERQELWRSTNFRLQFRQEWLSTWRKSFHRQLELMVIVRCPESDWQGLSFAEISHQKQQEPVDFFIQALQDYDTDLRWWVATGANDRLKPRLAMMRHPYILPGFTDAGAHVRNLGYYDGALSLLKQAITTTSKDITELSVMQIFNNWNVVAKGWYIACLSSELSKAKVKSLEICSQRIVLFRGEDGRVRALDAYCPHLGTDLGLGKVDGNWLRCAFHHWAFDETGGCQNIPCQSEIPAKAKLSAYATEEKYGFIWVYPDALTPHKVPEFDDLKGKEIVTQADKPLERNCHHHVCMMNGIDAQHLKTIHHLDIKMELLLSGGKSGTQIDFTMRGQFPSTTFRERIGQKLLGSTYEYSMRYTDGCIGLLTMMKNVQLLPPLHMIYAYTPIAPGRTRIQPIYITEKRKGIIGYVISKILLLFTRLFYYMLRDEDGKIYDNIQFNPNIILPIDTPLAAYMCYVNKLEPSRWLPNQQ